MGLRVSTHEVDRVRHGSLVKLLGSVISDGDVELLLERKDELDAVKRAQLEILLEPGGGRKLGLVDPLEVLDGRRASGGRLGSSWRNMEIKDETIVRRSVAI